MVPGHKDVAVRKCRRHAAVALAAAVVCALALAAPAGAGSISTVDLNYGFGGDAFPGIGPGSYSPEMVGVGGTFFGGVDATGAALANLNGNGKAPQAFLPSGRLDLAPASVSPSVPVFDVVSNSPTPRYAAGSRWAAAAAWSEQPNPGHRPRSHRRRHAGPRRGAVRRPDARRQRRRQPSAGAGLGPLQRGAHRRARRGAGRQRQRLGDEPRVGRRKGEARRARPGRARPGGARHGVRRRPAWRAVRSPPPAARCRR